MVEVTVAKAGGPLARLAESGARLPAERALEGEGPIVVQRAGAGGDDRARPRVGREAPAARGPNRLQARRARDPARLSQRRRAVRGRGTDELSLKSIEALLRPPPAPKSDDYDIALRPSRSAARRRGRARRRRRLAADGAGALLPAGAARRDRGLRHARQGRRRPPRRLHEPARARRPLGRARHRRRLGQRRCGASGRSIRSTSASRRATAAACCATSPRCSPRRRSTSRACARNRFATAPAAPRS